jgi:hypothetical protein
MPASSLIFYQVFDASLAESFTLAKALKMNVLACPKTGQGTISAQ